MIGQIDIKESPSIPTIRKEGYHKIQPEDDGRNSENLLTETKIISNDLDFDALEQVWNELAWVSDTHIFQTFEWNRMWWKHFGTKKRLHIVTVYIGNKLIGIAPLFEDDVNLFNRKVYSCLRFLGSYVSQPDGEPLIGMGSYSDYLDVIVEKGFEDSFARVLTEHIQNARLSHDKIILDEVNENSVSIQYLIPQLKRQGLNISIKYSSVCTNILLDSSWDLYLNRLSKNNRKKTRKYLKGSNDDENKKYLVVDALSRYSLEDAISKLVHVHQKQWNNRGFTGTFYEKRMLNFNMDIAQQFNKNGWLLIKELTSVNTESETINSEMYYIYKKRIYSVHGGTDPESSHNKNGVGNITFTTVLKEAIDNGFQVFDYMRGEEGYKVKRGDKFITNRTVQVHNPSNNHDLLHHIIKQKIKLYRRIKIEFIQIGLFFRNRHLLDGIRTYWVFLIRRTRFKRPLSL